MLATDGRGRQSRLDAVFQLRTLGLFRLRLVLDVGLFVGLGTVPLWSLVSPSQLGLVLGTGHSLGAFLGRLAAKR